MCHNKMERWKFHGNISRNGYGNAIIVRYGGRFEEGIWWVYGIDKCHHKYPRFDYTICITQSQIHLFKPTQRTSKSAPKFLPESQDENVCQPLCISSQGH